MGKKEKLSKKKRIAIKEIEIEEIKDKKSKSMRNYNTKIAQKKEEIEEIRKEGKTYGDPVAMVDF